MIQLSSLAQHAIDNVWCNPGLDNQTILAPKRISPSIGVRNNFTIMWDPYLLPTNIDVYHVFQIGGINPVVLGLFQTNVYTPSKTWISMMDICNTKHTTINIYNRNGISIPLHSVYYNYTISGDLVIAIKENTSIPIDWVAEQLYIRIYTNAYFLSNTVVPLKPNVFGGTLTTALDVTIFVNTCATYTGIGKLFIYVNGYLVDSATMFNIYPGDTAEAVWDASVLKTVDISVDTLTTFNSLLDNKSKYLLHYPNDGVNAIEYWDDNDIYIVNKLNPQRPLGVFYHNNAIDATRMVTHRDYSIVVAYVQDHINVLSAGANVIIPNNQLSVRLIIRRPATVKPLSFNSSLINELYKLKDADIVRTMTGNVLGPVIWSASALESSGYTAMMRSSYQDYIKGIYSASDVYVKQAYSHNNVAVLMANTPQLPAIVNTILTVNVPSGLQSYSTVYEYDANGLYLGNYPIVAAAIYHPFNPTCAMVEILKGVGGIHNGWILSNPTLVNVVKTDIKLLQPTRDLLVYVRPINNLGTPTGAWVIQNRIDPLLVSNNMLLLSNMPMPSLTEYLIRVDSKFLCYDTIINIINGVYSFTLEEQITLNGVNTLMSLQNPLLMLDIFLNGHSLIEGVDYVLNGTLVTILNIKWLLTNGTGPQNIHVRYLGLDQNIDYANVAGGTVDKGWVAYNMLSNNNRYDFTEGIVQRVVVDGKVVSKSAIVFSDNHVGVGVPNVLNGTPYSVTDLPISTAYFLNNVGTSDLLINEYKSERVMYKNVANYMNSLLPQFPRTGLSAIPNKYSLYSPFISSLINALVTSVISINSLMPNLTDNEIVAICQPYEYLLVSDPIKLNLDNQYVLITPHPHGTVMQLSFFQYRFLNNVIRLYCNGLVSLSPSVVMV